MIWRLLKIIMYNIKTYKNYHVILSSSLQMVDYHNFSLVVILIAPVLSIYSSGFAGPWTSIIVYNAKHLVLRSCLIVGSYHYVQC